MKCQILFSGKNFFNLLSAELAQRVVKKEISGNICVICVCIDLIYLKLFFHNGLASILQSLQTVNS